MMNQPQTFTADTAKQVALDRKKMMKESTLVLADKIVNHVMSVYAKEVQTEINRDVYSNSVKIKIPKGCRKALLKLSDNEYSILKDNVDKRLSKNGFSARLTENSWSCNDCLFKYLACTKYYHVKLSWD